MPDEKIDRGPIQSQLGHGGLGAVLDEVVDHGLVPACLAVCDVHTRLCEVACDTQATEFNNGEFSRTPIEILMIFKLRQRLGLHNPVIDHPLMQSPLGLLPDEVRFESIAAGPDDLIYRVRAKMMEDEYDEEAIVRSGRVANVVEI